MTTTDSRPDGQMSKAAELEATAKQEAQAVKESVTAAGRETSAALAEQTAAVANTAKQQFDTLVGQAKREFSSQAESQGNQVIRGLHTISDEVAALAAGRPQDAGQLGTVLTDVQQRLQRYVSSLDMRGPQGLVDDVTRFARRKPALFLLGAGLAGFAVGRLVRSAAGQDGEVRQFDGSRDWTQRPPDDQQRAAAYATQAEEPWPTPL
jgi:hypothetical protein